MMNRTLKFVLIFAVLSIVSVFGTRLLGIEFGQQNFWDHHGFIFLICIAFFPRLTLLFSNVVSGGLVWWLGWIFAPRLLVAFLATIAYWNQNPVLVVLSWLVAVGGETSEKTVIVRRPMHRSRYHTHTSANAIDNSEIIDVTPNRPT